MSDLVGNPEDRFSHNEAHFHAMTLGKHGHAIYYDFSRLQKQYFLNDFVLYIFLIFVQNIDPQSINWTKNQQSHVYSPVNPSFTISNWDSRVP